MFEGMFNQFAPPGGMNSLAFSTAFAQNPEALVPALAQAGIGPPQGAMMFGQPSEGFGALAAPKMPVGAPMSLAPPNPGGAAAPTAAPTSAGGVNDLARMLSGVAAPPSPEVQKIQSPNVPRPAAAIGQSNLIPLLSAALGGGSPDMLRLAQAIGGGR